MSEYRYVAEQAAALERARIRRLVAPHLDTLRLLCATFEGCGHRVVCLACQARFAIDAATRSPRKARKGK